MVAWSDAVRRPVPRISLPVITPSSGIPWGSIPESTESAENGQWSSEEGKTEEAYSFIIDQGINDSRLDP